MFVDASCAASAPPVAKARLIWLIAPSASGLPICSMNLNTGSISKLPTAAPPKVEVLFWPSVAPPSSARTRASPAPAPTPSAVAPTRPAIPKGPAKKNGIVDPSASLPLRGMESSYPGAAANGAFADAARLAIPVRAFFSKSVGRRAEAPVAALSNSPIAPEGIPFRASLAYPPIVVLGANSGNCVRMTSPALSRDTSSGNSTVRPSGRSTV